MPILSARVVALASVAIFGSSFGFAFAGCGSETTTVTTTVSGASGASGVVGVNEPGPASEKDTAASADPIETVRRYYELVGAGNFDAAWSLLPADVQAESEGFDRWRQGYATTVSTVSSNLKLESETGDTAIVSLDLAATDRDACSGALVEQDFAGTWTLERAGEGWTATAADLEKVSGGTPTINASECPVEGPPKPTQASCTPGYSPCLPPASDYDCEGGTGDGPEYTGQVFVSGSDPYDLDADGNGSACE